MLTRKRRGALELSIGTIVVIVIAVTTLILGLVLVRSIMCGAVGLTGEVNSKVRGELNRLFGQSGGEVQCIGAGEPVKIIPGQNNFVYCSIRAKETAQYAFTVTSIKFSSSTVTQAQLNTWLAQKDTTFRVAPNDEEAKKVATILIPEDAPEGLLTLDFAVKRDAQELSSKRVDFDVSRQGLVRATLC